MNILVLALITLLASLCETIAGFGIGTILTPLLLFYYPVTQVLFFVGTLHFFHNLLKTIHFRKSIDAKLAIQFGVPALIAGFVGALLITGIPGQWVFITFGIFFIIYALSILLFQDYKVRASKSPSVAFMGGCLTGFSAGFFGQQGAIRSAFLVLFDLPAATFIAISGVISLFADTSRLLTYAYHDFAVLTETYYSLLVCLPITLISVWLGSIIVKYIPAKQFRTVIAYFLLLFGIYSVIRGILL